MLYFERIGLHPVIMFIITFSQITFFQPVNLTILIGIHNRETGMRPLAWRHLGFIPRLLGTLIPSIEHCSQDVGFLHLCNWHHVSKFLLSDLLCLLDKECLEWNYRGKLVRLHIPIMFVIGDIEGHDKLCSRKHGHITKMGGVTHSCDIRRNKCNDPNATCNMF